MNPKIDQDIELLWKLIDNFPLMERPGPHARIHLKFKHASRKFEDFLPLYEHGLSLRDIEKQTGVADRPFEVFYSRTVSNFERPARESTWSDSGRETPAFFRYLAVRI